MKSHYHQILTDSTIQTFKDYNATLKIPTISYLAIGIQNKISKNSASLMSNNEWALEFVKNEYADHDPVRKASLNSNNKIIPFSSLDFGSSLGKEIMAHRKRLGIHNGMAIMLRGTTYNYIITLGSDYSKFDSFDFLEKYHHPVFELLIPDLIKIIQFDCEEFMKSECYSSLLRYHTTGAANSNSAL